MISTIRSIIEEAIAAKRNPLREIAATWAIWLVSTDAIRRGTQREIVANVIAAHLRAAPRPPKRGTIVPTLADAERELASMSLATWLTKQNWAAIQAHWNALPPRWKRAVRREAAAHGVAFRPVAVLEWHADELMVAVPRSWNLINRLRAEIPPAQRRWDRLTTAWTIQRTAADHAASLVREHAAARGWLVIEGQG